MLELRTLGAAYVLRSDGTRLTGAVAQRRSLALLSVLAVHGEDGLSRDRILALLWPDGEPEKIRHALTQSLYHIRRALECDDLFITTGSDVRLNGSRMTSDVGRFVGLVEAGANEEAAALYAGPFLDGFFLPSAAEFEQWVSAQRLRYERAACRALERLADAAEAREDWSAAVEGHKRLVSIDPVSATATMKLMRALWGSGDRPAAIQQGRIHAALVRSQLEIEPDAAVVELIDELTAARDTPQRIRLLRSGEIPRVDAGSDVGILALPPETPVSTEPIAAPRPWWRTSRRTSAWIAGAAVIAAVAFVIGRPRADAAGSTVSIAEPVLVAPFRVSGSDPSLAYLREGMIELISSRLADDSAARAVDPGRVIGAWRTTRLSGAADTRESAALSIAHDLGATRVIIGGIVGTASKIVMSASLMSVRHGDILAQATVEGPVDSLTTLVDRLAARLIASSAGEGERLGDRFTPSLAALHDFLEGQAAYRRGDYAQAVPAYERALAKDSGFALAAMHLALAADGINDAEQHDRALQLAWANRGDLNAQDAAHLVAFAGPRYPQPSLESEQVAAWERAVVTAPDRADVWYELGERLFRSGGVAGLMTAHVRAKVVLSRALELDPSHLRARRLLIMLAARTSDLPLLARIASPEVLRDSVGDLSPFLRWRVALERGDSVELRRIRAEMPQLNDQSLRAIAMSSINDGVGLEDGTRAAGITMQRADRSAAWFDAVSEQHSLALNSGQPTRALELTRQLAERDPGSRAYLRLRVLDALYSEGDAAAGQAAADSLAVFADAPPSPDESVRSVQLADLCVVEQWRLQHRLTTSARRAIALLHGASQPRQTIQIAANQHTCASLLEAMYAIATASRDAPRWVAEVDSLMLSGPAVSDASSYANIVIGRMYRRLGNPRAALIAYRRRTYMNSWMRYVSTARREEAEVAMALGETEIARTSFARYLALRRTPESRLAVSVDTVRQRARSLDGAIDR